jgi:hypothetical protein
VCLAHRVPGDGRNSGGSLESRPWILIGIGGRFAPPNGSRESGAALLHDISYGAARSGEIER